MLTRGFSWTDQNVEILRQMLGNGSPASEVAARIGCSRNAVIGKACRMQIAMNGARAKGSAVKSVVSRLSERRIRRVAAVQVEPQEFDGSDLAAEPETEPSPAIRKTIIQGLTERDCLWPMGHVEGEQTFCCEETVVGYSWCDAHKKRVFVPRVSGAMPILDWRARG
jgi:GcrA cell cycle regulator